ncbi:FxSxx-COOH system tetratricopeptide repeat protein [Streptomyces sp. NPDC051940]|uniref:FxSxx-COOH system tetratricopeptide repeat protein n=1 Tax=Streptomyces sp. NPDC051940 TaxID=3155675 RepID=UPI0034233D2B
MAEQNSHITVSYAGFNRPWAAWVAHQLELRGMETSLVRWDPNVKQPFTGEFRKLLQAPDRVLLVLDDWYFRLGPIRPEDWNTAVREVVVGPDAERIVTASVATLDLPAEVLALAPVGLRDLDEQEAIRRICRRLAIPNRPVVQDTASAFAPRFPNDPPSVWDVPRRNRRFTGRDQTLERLRRILAGDSSAGNSGTRIVLRGISGVGKSQIATEYAHRFGNDYDVVWWIGSDYRATARERLAALAPRLGLAVGQGIGERIRAVHDALRTGRPHRRWLLIFDGADDKEQLTGLLPDGGGHVLITAQTRDWAEDNSAREIPVDPFTRTESIAYVVRRSPRVSPEEADELAEAVQDLPLLLAQTAAWLDTNQMAVRDYVREIRFGRPEGIAIRTSEDYPMGFLTSWSIAFNALRGKHPEAAELLKLFVFFAPHEIPVTLLTSARRGVLPSHLDRMVSDPIRWHNALRRLSESTAVRLNYQAAPGQEPTVDRVQMHRLYHRFLQSALTDEERDTLSGTACQVLVDADPRRPFDTRDWEAYAGLLPHLETSGALGSRDPGVQELVRNCIEYLRSRGEYRTGLRLCELALSQLRGRLEPTDPTMLVLEHQHANMLRRSGRYREAEDVGRRVVDGLASAADESPADLLRAKDNLAGTLLALADYQQAHDLFEEVWLAYQELFGDEAPRTMASRSNLGLSLGLLGRYEESLNVHREVLLIRERRLRSRHNLTLRSGANYAYMLRLVGRYAEAASRLEQIVRLRRQIADEHNPETILAEHQLGICRRREGNLRAAEQLLSGAVQRARLVHGPEHPETLLVEADHATFLREHGDLSEAQTLARTVYQRYRDLVGFAHPYTIGTRGNLGLVLGESGDRAEALHIAEETHRDMSQVMGPDHPWTLGSAINLASARSRSDESESALELSRGTLERAKSSLGEVHPMTLSAKMALADDLRSLRRATEGSKVEQEAVQQLRETLGPEHPHTVDAVRRVRPYWDFEPQPT